MTIDSNMTIFLLLYICEHPSMYAGKVVGLFKPPHHHACLLFLTLLERCKDGLDGIIIFVNKLHVSTHGRVPLSGYIFAVLSFEKRGWL